MVFAMLAQSEGLISAESSNGLDSTIVYLERSGHFMEEGSKIVFFQCGAIIDPSFIGTPIGLKVNGNLLWHFDVFVKLWHARHLAHWRQHERIKQSFCTKGRTCLVRNPGTGLREPDSGSGSIPNVPPVKRMRIFLLRCDAFDLVIVSGVNADDGCAFDSASIPRVDILNNSDISKKLPFILREALEPPNGTAGTRVAWGYGGSCSYLCQRFIP